MCLCGIPLDMPIYFYSPNLCMLSVVLLHLISLISGQHVNEWANKFSTLAAFPVGWDYPARIFFVF